MTSVINSTDLLETSSSSNGRIASPVVVNKSFIKSFVSNNSIESNKSEKALKKSKRNQRILNVSQSNDEQDLPKASNWSKLKTRLVELLFYSVN